MFSDPIGETLDILHLQWGYVAAIVCKQARNYMFEGYQGSPGYARIISTIAMQAAARLDTQSSE